MFMAHLENIVVAAVAIGCYIVFKPVAVAVWKKVRGK